MKKMIKNILLFLSAFVPMYFLIFVKLVVEIINDNLHFNVLNTLNFVTLLLLIGLGIVGLVWNIKYSSKKSIKIEVVSRKNITDQHFLGYFSLFVFFAIPLDLSYVSAYCVYVLVLVMIGIVYISNSLYYINPLLNLLGYKFFDVEFKFFGQNEIKQVKMFTKTDIPLGQCFINIKNEHFCFLNQNLWKTNICNNLSYIFNHINRIKLKCFTYCR